ncbi:MAG: hypothetical protein JSV85_03730 [Candidatus Bathyarchaeota archaeon]|nr:MAG: hypothetical protein JSV85_03730 [Candidatus Bathyarchaeota archaeon]
MKWKTVKNLFRLYVLSILDVEALVFLIIICPFVFIISVLVLQTMYPPLGAIFFYAMYIPLVICVAVIDYHRKKKSS